MTSLSGEEVAKFVNTPPDVKVGPNGVEVRVSEVWEITNNTVAIFHGKIREVKPEKTRVYPKNDFYELPRGVYEVRIANQVTIPLGCVGFCHPRSTLNRLGVIKSETGIWDSGYRGYGTQTILVPIKMFKIHKDEFWFQIRMQRSEKSTHSYNGHWQEERPEKT